ncbi:hypothetical protein MTR_7g029445 [Medicago truncatula]|uniref:Uncharacterized protein n=1 Tax=Medicago truncatula TaxID=3880 RepID=A0A072TXY9_MEDTR|nr:hypothetical protein MTR_7g029445 [Medicago truncatula]
MWERVDSQFPDSQSLQIKTSFPKRKSARVGNSSCSQASTPIIQPFPNYHAYFLLGLYLCKSLSNLSPTLLIFQTSLCQKFLN